MMAPLGGPSRIVTIVRSNSAGFALESTLLIMLLISVLVVAAFAGVVTTVRTANFDYRNSRVFYAAEAGAEAIMAQLDVALKDGQITDAELAALSAPTLPGFGFDSFQTRKVGGIVQEGITDGSYAGLYSLTQRMEIYSSAVDAIGDRSSVMVSVKAQAIPLFQFGAFYERDLEITNGPAMTFGGWMHSNGNIYVSSNNAWYLNSITTPNKVFHDRKDNHNVLNGVYVHNASGTAVQLDFDSRSIPDPTAFKAMSNARFNNRLKTDAYQVDTLRLPLPAGMDPVEVVLPRKMTDTPQMQQTKFAWRADWYVEVPVDQINNPGKNVCPTMNTARVAGKSMPSVGDCQKIIAWTWDALFDGRERRFVDVLDIDLIELRNWVGTALDRQTQVLYVTFTGTPTLNAARDPRGDGVRPVVRLINGSQLPNALTVATDRSLYVQGDYNTTNWVPAALAGDALVILSGGWTDAQHQCAPYVPGTGPLTAICGGFTVPSANSTEIWAAVLAGHTGTPCDHEAAGCPGGYQDFYSGGLENFPRFLENWSGKTLKYRGSLVSLHLSAYATGTWNSSYYSPPQRDWLFETRFNDPVNLPPATPVVGNVIHTAFRPVY